MAARDERVGLTRKNRVVITLARMLVPRAACRLHSDREETQETIRGLRQQRTRPSSQTPLRFVDRSRSAVTSVEERYLDSETLGDAAGLRKRHRREVNARDASATARERDRVEADVALNVHDVEAVEACAISDRCEERLLLLGHE
jgi:hypothetical protein